MKIRLTFVALIILAQLCWVVFDYVQNTAELANAPRIVVEGSNYYSRIRIDSDLYEVVYLTADNPRLGKSIRWRLMEQKKDNTTRNTPDDDAKILTMREDTADAVQGGIELIISPDDNTHDIYISQINKNRHVSRQAPSPGGLSYIDENNKRQSVSDITFSAIWSKREDGLWDYRLEAAGSSEDVLREGELRTSAHIRYTLIQISKQDHNIYVRLNVNPFVIDKDKQYPNIHYPLSDDDARVYRTWKEGLASDKKEARPKITMELALRENKPPLATCVFVNGTPLKEALLEMQKGTFSLPAPPEPQPTTEPEPAQPDATAIEEPKDEAPAEPAPEDEAPADQQTIPSQP